MFEELAPRDRLAVIQRKQLCHFCFRQPDSQPCPSYSLPACPIQGCMRMHHKLLHEALQKEESRAIVIEVEEEPEKPGEDERLVLLLEVCLIHRDQCILTTKRV
jgi:hypothetical protein